MTVKAIIAFLFANFLAAMAAEEAALGLRFTAISVVETNLVLRVANPSGLTDVALETRTDLNAEWQALTALATIPADRELRFSMPKPERTMFMRLRADAAGVNGNTLSSALNYVTVPPLTLHTNPATGEVEAVLHFKGRVDGSDRMLVKRDGIFWEHVNWSWPEGDVAINHTSWRPAEQNFITVAGAKPLLPSAFGFDSAALEIIKARDVVALEQTSAGLMVYMNDTLSGADDYEFAIHFRPSRSKHAQKSTAATLKIKTVIDGSDCLHITAAGARWEHFQWRAPQTVSLNGVGWNLGGGQLLNQKENSFLPTGVDFSTARVIERKGRDLAAVSADEKELRIIFADNPGGSDTYELTIAFGD